MVISPFLVIAYFHFWSKMFFFLCGVIEHIAVKGLYKHIMAKRNNTNLLNRLVAVLLP